MSKALTVQDQTLDKLSKRINAMQESGELHFPPDYSPQNALKSAWLTIQATTDMNKKPALEVCTIGSIYNALFDMVITGLNPAKKQGYFIVYGKNLVFQRSYFGSETLAKRVNPDIADIVAEVVYEGDTFTYSIRNGQKIVSDHKQTLESVDSKKVKGAYCIVIDKNGEVIKTDIMTWVEIKKAWSMSKTKPIEKGEVKKGSTHDDFMSEMIKKTVINRTCKTIFNSSDDKYLKLAATRSEVIRAEDTAQEEIDQNANQDIIDIDDEREGEVVDAEFKETPEQERIYLHCPASINKNQPRKNIEVCEKCKHKMQCNSYAEHASDQKEEEPEESQKQATGTDGPDF